MSSTHRIGWGRVFLQDYLSDGRSEHTVGILKQFYDSQWSPIFDLGQILVLFSTKQKRASISTSNQSSQLWSVILNMFPGLNRKSGSTANRRFVSTFTHYAWFIRTPSSRREKSIPIRHGSDEYRYRIIGSIEWNIVWRFWDFVQALDTLTKGEWHTVCSWNRL